MGKSLTSAMGAGRAEPGSPRVRLNSFKLQASIAFLASAAKHLFNHRLSPRFTNLLDSFRYHLIAARREFTPKQFLAQRRLTQVLAPVVAYTLALPANSAQLWCRGRVTNTYVDSSGTLIVSGTWRADYTQLRNIKVVLNGIDPTTCLTWFSIAIASQTKGLDVQASYIDPSALACNTLSTYHSTPPPIYFMLFAAGVP